jgi:F0F1-type ATP synthase membrane subunit b/b'
MNDRDEPNLSPEDSISDEISERVRSVIAAAEGAATAIRHEAEQQVQIKRRAAEAERQRYLEDAKGEAEALLTERMKRISELSDSIIEGAEAILMRIEGAEEAKRQLETMVHALAAAAADLAAESDHGREPPRPRPVALDDNPPPRMRAVPDPAAAEPDPAAVTELHVPQSSTATGADSPAADAGAEPVPDAEPAVTEAEAPAAADDHGPAEPADLEPVDVLPEAEVADEEEVEVVDAVEVTDEEPEKRSAVERLRDAVQGVGGGNGAEAEAAGSEPEPERPQPQRAFDGDDMLAARLVALQMAVAGSARDEVEDHLRKAFSLDEPGTILNDVFGTESKL